jgi:hypothetical protein
MSFSVARHGQVPSIFELSHPLVNDLDDLCRVPVVKMAGAVDSPVGRAISRGVDDLLGIFVKEWRLGASDDGEQGTAYQFGVRPAVVAIIFAIFVQVAAGTENSRRGTDGRST